LNILKRNNKNTNIWNVVFKFFTTRTGTFFRSAARDLQQTVPEVS